MTLDVLRFLRDLVNNQQISAQHPDLVAVATLFARVRTELDEAITDKEMQ
jgi:hypothetical protein